MINVVCKKCGYKLPLSSKNKELTILNSTQSSFQGYKYNSDVVCPKCRRILIKGKLKIPNNRRNNE